MHEDEGGLDRRWPHLRQLPKGGWAEVRPVEACPACGLVWPVGTPGRVLVGTHPCRCGKPHRTYQCERCRAWLYVPELAEGRCSEDGPALMGPSGKLNRRKGPTPEHGAENA